jgi:hypothetical protein
MGEFAGGTVAGKVAAKAAKEAAKEQKAVNRELLVAATATPGFVVAAEAYGNRQAVKQQMLLRLYLPLAKIMGVSRDYFADGFAADLAKRTQEVPDDELQTPKASVAGPAMEGLGYSLEEPDLKNLYLELLARASDKREASRVHPSFAGVVRDLSEPEARYLPQFIADGRMKPVVQIMTVDHTSEQREVTQNHLLNLVDENAQPLIDPQLATYVDNWVRLGLIEVHYDRTLDEPQYAWVAERSEIQDEITRVRILNDAKNNPHLEVLADRGCLTPTSFGVQFAAVVGMSAPQFPDSPTR